MHLRNASGATPFAKPRLLVRMAVALSLCLMVVGVHVRPAVALVEIDRRGETLDQFVDRFAESSGPGLLVVFRRCLSGLHRVRR